MSWTYSGDPSNSILDQTRFLIGDTDSAFPLLQDEEINYVVGKLGSPEAAAPQLVSSIMAKLAKEVDYRIGPEQVEASRRFEAYKELVDSLRSLWISRNAGPIWTGSFDINRDRPIFDIGMTDYWRRGWWR